MESLVRAFNRKEVECRRSNEDRARVHQQQEPGIVDAVRYHAVQVLLRIAVRILEYPIVNSHGQRGDVAGNGGYLDAGFERCDVHRLKAASTGACDADALWVDFRARQQIIEGAQTIPDFPTR